MSLGSHDQSWMDGQIQGHTRTLIEKIQNNEEEDIPCTIPWKGKIFVRCSLILIYV